MQNLSHWWSQHGQNALWIGLVIWGIVIVRMFYVQLASYAQGGAGVTFVDVATQKGIVKTKFSYGVAWNDFNEDGFVDLYYNQHHLVPRPILYKNLFGFSFQDVADLTGIVENGDMHGAVWGDYDNDGDDDLYQNLGYHMPNYLYRNNGDGTFTEVAQQAGVDDAGRGRDVAWVDYNNNGYLDLFITNIGDSHYPSALFENQGNGTFFRKTVAAGLDKIMFATGQVWGDYNNDGWLDLLVWMNSAPQLFQNNGDGTFTETTSLLAGITGAINDIDWADYDNDGDLDLYVSRGWRRSGVTADASRIAWRIWASDPEGGFDFEVSDDALVTFDLYRFCDNYDTRKIFIGTDGSHPSSSRFTLGNGQSPDPDGKPSYIPGVSIGIFIWRETDGSETTVWHLRSYGEVNSGVVTATESFTNTNPYNLERDPTADGPPNQLWENIDGTHFVNVTASANVGDRHQSHASVWGDFDNDGDMDLYVVNYGHFLGNEPNTYYVNNGDKTFTDSTTSVGLTAFVDGFGHTPAVADYNRDGFLDIFVTNGWDGPGPFCGGPDMLFENQGNGNHWLDLRTVGTISNRNGIGAQVILKAGGTVQYRQQVGGQHSIVQNSPLLHFGLGTMTYAEAITITWPGGLQQTLYNVPADQILGTESCISGKPSPIFARLFRPFHDRHGHIP